MNNLLIISIILNVLLLGIVLYYILTIHIREHEIEEMIHNKVDRLDIIKHVLKKYLSEDNYERLSSRNKERRKR